MLEDKSGFVKQKSFKKTETDCMLERCEKLAKNDDAMAVAFSSYREQKNASTGFNQFLPICK